MEIFETLKSYWDVLFGKVEDVEIQNSPIVKEEEKTKEPEILEYPKKQGEAVDGSKGIILFSEGSRAVVFNAELKEDEWKFCLLPDRRLIKDFDLTSEVVNNSKEGFIVRTYPAKKILVLREDYNLSNIYFCMLNINGEGKEELCLSLESERIKALETIKELKEEVEINKNEYLNKKEEFEDSSTDEKNRYRELEDGLFILDKEKGEISSQLVNAKAKISELEAVDEIKIHSENKELKEELKVKESEYLSRYLSQEDYFLKSLI